MSTRILNLVLFLSLAIGLAEVGVRRAEHYTHAASVSRVSFTITTPNTTPACPAGTTQLLADQSTAVSEAPVTSVGTVSIAPVTSVSVVNHAYRQYRTTSGSNVNGWVVAYTPMNTNGTNTAWYLSNTSTGFDSNGELGIITGASATSYTVATSGSATTYTWHYRVCAIP